MRTWRTPLKHILIESLKKEDLENYASEDLYDVTVQIGALIGII